jgi:hypothetical protein
MEYLIILTCTVNIQNKLFLYQIDQQERLDCYIKAINQWLIKTKLKILIVENSGYPFNQYFQNDRLQIVSFKENEITEANYLNGNNSKGASELFSINYALSKCKFSYNFVIKITGRYFIPYFYNYLNKLKTNNFNGIRQFNEYSSEIIGCDLDNIDKIFNTNDVENHIESTYKKRFMELSKIIVLPLFKISPTQRGGINEIILNI